MKFRRLSSTAVVAVVFLAVALIVVLDLLHNRTLTFKHEVDFLSFITITGFSITIFQLGQNQKAQEEKFVTDFVSKLYIDTELSTAFHDLVETYDNPKFREINERATQSGAKEARLARREPVFDLFDDLQGYRKFMAGSRYYHPDCFQGSEEERRLDGLLGYLDIIGYHYHYGVIPMSILAGMLNSQLSTLVGRDVIRYYLGVSANEDWFATTDIQRKSGAVQVPFLYLRNMLSEYQKYNKDNQARLKKDQDKIAKRSRHLYGLK